MNKKALVLAICVSFSSPTISVANVLPDNLFGLNLGEIQSKSNLHEPFKAIIPILFTSTEEARQLQVRLAPKSIFRKVGAEKSPIHDKLNFKISLRNHKPVILVSSVDKIQTPFVSFVLEVVSPEGSYYQDYTALVDPVDYRSKISVSSNDRKEKLALNSLLEGKQSIPELSAPELDLDKIQSNLLLAAFSSPRLKSGTPTKYIVKHGDSLSQVAQSLNTGEVSLKRMIDGIYLSNPTAFLNNNIHQLIRGATLDIPTIKQLKDFSFDRDKKIPISVIATESSPHKVFQKNNNTNKYIVKRGDTLSKIVRQVGSHLQRCSSLFIG